MRLEKDAATGGAVLYLEYLEAVELVSELVDSAPVIALLLELLTEFVEEDDG